MVLRTFVTRFGSAALAAALCSLGLRAAGAQPVQDTGTPAATAGIREFAVAAGVLPVVVAAPVDRLRITAPPGAVDDGRLAALRGGTETPWSDMKLNGTVGSNVASNVVTGANVITEGAFSNASGLPMVIQNSGANVLIQNATIVNVQFQ